MLSLVPWAPKISAIASIVLTFEVINYPVGSSNVTPRSIPGTSILSCSFYRAETSILNISLEALHCASSWQDLHDLRLSLARPEPAESIKDDLRIGYPYLAGDCSVVEASDHIRLQARRGCY